MEGQKEEFKRVAENLFIRQSTGKYYAIIKKNGRQTRQSLKTTVRTIADSKLHNLRIKLGTSSHKTKSQIPIFSEAVEAFIIFVQSDGMKPNQLKCLSQHLRSVAKSFIGTTRVHQIRTEQIKEYLHAQRFTEKRTICGKTANDRLNFTKRLFAYCIKQGWLWHNPALEIEPFEHKTKKMQIPTTDELKAILSYLRASKRNDGPKAADFIEMLALSGMRRGGAQTIRWEDIDFRKNIFSVTEKGEKTRQVDMFPALRTFLESRKSNGALFPPEGKKRLFEPKKSLMTACTKLGFHAYTFHSFRHYFATECLEKEITPPIVAGWLGHSDNGILVMKLYGNHIRRKFFAEQAKRVTIDLRDKPAQPLNAA